MSYRFPLILSCCILSLSALPGCAVIGLAAAGGAVGVASAQEGGLKAAASDFGIQATINDLWFKHDTSMFTKLDLTVQRGRVLITGVVQNPEHRVEAVRLAWQPDGVEQVINEIQIAESKGIRGYASDSWISTRIRTAITFDKQVQSINYSIDTVQGIVYLMGVAQTRVELDRVVDIARRTSNVKQVVSYVKIAGTPDDNAQAPVGSAPIYDNAPISSAGAEAQFDAPDNYVRPSAVIDGTPTPLVSSPSLDTSTQVIESEELLWSDR